MTPADENECRQMLYTAFAQDHPVAVRYPRGAGAGVAVEAEMTALPFGTRRDPARASRTPGSGKRIAILAFGTLLYPALAAAERLDATVANMRFVKPLDVALRDSSSRARHDAIVTVEEGCIMGGAGSAVRRGAAAARHRDAGAARSACPTASSSMATRPSCWPQCGLDAAGIEQSVLERFAQRPALAACREPLIAAQPRPRSARAARRLGRTAGASIGIA